MARYDEIDLAEVRARVREFAEVIEDPTRPEQLERLIHHARGLSR